MSSFSLFPDQEQGIRQAPTPEENELSLCDVTLGVGLVAIVALLMADVTLQERDALQAIGETFIALCLMLWLITIAGLPRKTPDQEAIESPDMSLPVEVDSED